MSEPLVSVHMTTYNHAPYIVQAIEGVLMQKTNFPFELIIGEDCSTDGTRDIVLEYAQKYPKIIRLITSEKNVGMKKNSYRTMQACQGKYIAFCEGDDWWHRDNKLQIQVEYFENHPECGLVHSDYHRHYAISNKIVLNFNKSNNIVVKDNLNIDEIIKGDKYLVILTVTVMVRKDIAKIIIDKDYIIYQSSRFLIGDTPLWAEISAYSGTHYINDSLSYYRILNDSASKFKDKTQNLRFGLNNQELFLYIADKYGLSPVTKRYHEKLWANYALLLAFIDKNAQQAESAKYFLSPMSIKQYIYYFGTVKHRIRPIVLLLKKFIKSKF